MDKLDLLKSEVLGLVNNDELTFFWQRSDESCEEPVFAYTSPELGIMSSETSPELAVASAIDMLVHIHKHYEQVPAKLQDRKEMLLVQKVHSLYVQNKEAFCSILGLNPETALQGEKI